MSLGLPPLLIRRFLAMSEDDQRALLSELSPAMLLALDADFEIWANQGQRMPPGEGWRVWLMMAGRGFGKTRAGAEWVHGLAKSRSVRIALVGANIDEARSIMVEGASGLLSVARSRNVRMRREPSVKRLTWPNGSVAELYSGDHADGLRGPEHGFAWCAAADRLPAVPGGRGTASPGAARPSGDRTGLCRRQRRDRAVGRPRRRDRRLWRRWMAFVAAIEGMSVIDRSNGEILLRRGGIWEAGVVRAREIRVNAQQVVGARQAAIAAPGGGTTIDAAGRTAIAAILSAMRAHGLIEP